MRRIAILSTCLIVLGFTSSNAKGEKTNDAKTTEAVAAPNETESTAGATVKWFHYVGDASDDDQLSDPSMYTAEASPTCSSTSATYRCDIKILSNAAGNQPDLSQTIQDTRTRTNP